MLAQEKIYNICSSGKKTKVTLTELYGFLMWILTALGYIGYQFWAFVPEHILQNLGIHYIPNKYMSVAIPAWICITCWCMLMLYLSHSMMHTHSKNSYFTMQDRHSALAHPRDIDHDPKEHLGKAQINNHFSSSAILQNATPPSIIKAASTPLFQERQEKLNKRGENRRCQYNIDPYRKIPNCVELPITVVNNVLYANYNQY